MATSTTNPKRALIYVRVSSDPKQRLRSVNEQERECRETCEREGWDVVKVVKDNDRSASRYAKQERTGWAEVHRRIEDGEVDVLVTWEASRAQRDLAAYAELRDLCGRTNTLWSYSGATYDLSGREGRFRTGLDALLAEDEAERTRERVLRAMRSNAGKGRPHGRLLFGYRRVYDEATGDLLRQEPDPEQAPLVQEAVRRTLAGESAYAIAKDWREREVPTPWKPSASARANTPRAWQPSQITRMLKKPAYAGLRVHRGEVVGEAEWEPLITRDDWDRLQAIVLDPARRTSRNHDAKRLLTGVARCGVCGSPASYGKQGGFTDGKGVERPVRLVYRCRYNQCVTRDMPYLDEYVTELVLARLGADDAQATLATDETDDAAASARSEADELRQRLEDATQAFTRGELTAATLGRIESDLLPKIKDAERSVRTAGLPTVVHDLAADDDPAALWQTLSVEQRREIVRSLMDVTILPTKRKGQRGFDETTVRIDWKRT